MRFRGVVLITTACIFFGAGLSIRASVPPGDAQHGALLMKSLGCVQCHSVAGEGGRGGPALDRTAGRGYSPTDMSAAMWNHAPAMWSAMEKRRMTPPVISQEQAADLFAYLYAARFFEPKGDVQRGRKAFAGKGCADCHNVASANAAGGRPVINWESVTDAMELARQMWNHAPAMREAALKSGKPVPRVSATEMNDIIVYLQSLPQTRNLKPQATFASAKTGEQLFELKGCAGCHTGAQSLARGGNAIRGMGEIAAGMWNHAGVMKQSSALRPEEMTRIVAYVWSLQFGLPTGNVADGRKLYETKGCNGCHGANPPASVTGENGTPYGMVAALWNHGPAMLKKTSGAKAAWPRLSNEEMNHLITWLGTVK